MFITNKLTILSTNFILNNQQNPHSKTGRERTRLGKESTVKQYIYW